MFKIFVFILSIFCVDIQAMRLDEVSSLQKNRSGITGFWEVERLLKECTDCAHVNTDDCFKSFFQVKIDSTGKRIDLGFEDIDFIPFIVMRHFPSNSNSAGKASDAGTDLQLTNEYLVLIQNISMICKGIYPLIAPAAQVRSVTTAVAVKYANEPIYSYKQFNEQNLGDLEGKSIEEILRCESFYKSLQDSSFKIPGGESGNDVIARIKLGIQGLATRVDRHPLLPMIISSRCTMNWMLRFLSGNLQLPPVMFENGDSFMFFYSLKSQSAGLLMQGDSPLILKPTDLLHLVCLPENQNIFGRYRILDDAVEKMSLVGSIQKIRKASQEEAEAQNI